jgi:uncharacterized membrane protein YkoI
MRTLIIPIIMLSVAVQSPCARAQTGAQTGAPTVGCFADWSEAAAVVKAEGLVTVEQLTKLAPAKLGGDIVRTTLCNTESGYTYKLVIRSASGKMSTVSVDAKNPF